MNLLPGVAEGDVIRAGPLTVPRPANVTGRVIVGVRPEDLSRGRGMQGTIELVEPLGRHYLVHVRAGDVLVIASFEAREMPQTGETIELEVRQDAIHIFDAETEERIS